MPKKEKKKNTKVNSWNLAGTFKTFEEADSKRKKISENKGTQTKVRHRESKNCFTVHYRSEPEQKKDKKK